MASVVLILALYLSIYHFMIVGMTIAVAGDTCIRSKIIRKICEMKQELKAYEAALRAFDEARTVTTAGPEMRFYRMRPLDSARIVLREAGRALGQRELTDAIIAGGAIVGKKRGESNIRISIEMTLANGKLKEIGGRLGLPDWDESMFAAR